MLTIRQQHIRTWRLIFGQFNCCTIHETYISWTQNEFPSVVHRSQFQNGAQKKIKTDFRIFVRRHISNGTKIYTVIAIFDKCICCCYCCMEVWTVCIVRGLFRFSIIFSFFFFSIFRSAVKCVVVYGHQTNFRDGFSFSFDIATDPIRNVRSRMLISPIFVFCIALIYSLL